MPVQLHPITPTLKLPGTKGLRLKYDELLSSFAFDFKLRRYAKVPSRQSFTLEELLRRPQVDYAMLEVRAYTRSLFSSS
jgi:hypothetical protein